MTGVAKWSVAADALLAVVSCLTSEIGNVGLGRPLRLWYKNRARMRRDKATAEPTVTPALKPGVEVTLGDCAAAWFDVVIGVIDVDVGFGFILAVLVVVITLKLVLLEVLDELVRTVGRNDCFVDVGFMVLEGRSDEFVVAALEELPSTGVLVPPPVAGVLCAH